MGNTFGTLVATHGARSPSRVDALAAQIAADLLAGPDCPPYLAEGSYRAAVAGWATAEAVCRLLRDWLAEQDVGEAMTELTEGTETEAAEGPKVRKSMSTRRIASVLDQLHKHETRAMHLRARLGLDPLSRARLGADLASAKWDLARLWAEEDAREAAASRGGGEVCGRPDGT